MACGATAALVAAGATTAIADNVVLGDKVESQGISLGTIACGQAQNVSLTTWIKRTGGENKNVFANSAQVTLAVSSASSSITATSEAVVTLPANWDNYGNGNTSPSAQLTASVLSTTEGAGSATVYISATGPSSVPEKTPMTERSAEVTISWKTASCAKNTAPSAPGAPQADPAGPGQGGFTLNWSPSTDAEGDAFTYTLQGKNAKGEAWTVFNLPNTSYTFGASDPAEGTWTYRVMAVETSTSPALSSGWSADSSPVVVDRTGPNAPSASAGDPAYVGEGKSWWKGSVTVRFSDNGDPALADGSDGSGVVEVTGPYTPSEQGRFEAVGRATDAAGNMSAPTVYSGYLDNEAPKVELSCPTGPITQGSTSSATWSASDEGGSGVAGATSGSVALDSSAIGSKTFTLPAGSVMDNVGYESGAKSCDYTVIYDWSGFFRPVVSGLNVAKAGSAVPIKFSLHGDQGLDIIASGSPTFTIKGAGGVQTVTSGKSELSYDPSTDQYTYVWKTDKAWAGKSGTFALALADGTTHKAEFSFTK